MTKSELIIRLAELNPNLFHRDIERIVNCYLTPLPMLWLMVSAWNCVDLVRFPFVNATPDKGAIRAQANRLRWMRKKSPFSRWGNPCLIGLIAIPN